jgi:peroxiredoxin Q/BCP
MTLIRPAVFTLVGLFATVQAFAQPVAEVAPPEPPAVGEAAPAVTLTSTTGEQVDLAETFAGGKTVLVVLRGYPGYQCPACSAQTGDLIRNAKKFADAGVAVVVVYPGQQEGLEGNAEEFLTEAMAKVNETELPGGVTLLLDPDYELVNAYGLRWMAPNETAYPATFVIAKGGEITFAEVSNTHAGRVEAKKALEAAQD